MTQDELYMQRCLQLATKGRGYVNPNPMVGAVIVCRGKIIGEGYHRCYGENHAEANAIHRVRDKSLLKDATIYVSLEPCSHYGKTPPCAQLIIDSEIPSVVVACLDPFPLVSGRGVSMLQSAGIKVEVGVLEEEAKLLNKEFITAQTQNRPYIYLKWAQTQDGFIDKERKANFIPASTPISNNFSKILLHKRRTEIAAIGIGTNTAMNDNPSLTARLWWGSNPTRIVLDKTRRIPDTYTLFDDQVSTLIFTKVESKEGNYLKTKFIKNEFEKDNLAQVLEILATEKINSILIEGGRLLLQDLIDKQLWDEAFIETATNIQFGKGLKAPTIEGNKLDEYVCKTSKHLHLINPSKKLFKFITNILL